MPKYFLFLIWSFVLLSCNGTKQLSSVEACKSVTVTKGDDFFNLSTSNYQLLSARYEGDCLYTKIAFQGKLESIRLHWNETVLERLPIQINSKIIIKTDDSKRKYEEEFGFDLNSFGIKDKKYWIYFLDDEDSILIEK